MEEKKRTGNPLHRRIQYQDKMIQEQNQAILKWKDLAEFWEDRGKAFEDMGKFLLKILKKNYSKLDEEDRDKLCACESFCQFAEFLDEVYQKC